MKSNSSNKQNKSSSQPTAHSRQSKYDLATTKSTSYNSHLPAMSFTTLPDMRFASTIRNSFQNQYNTIIKKRLAQEGKLGTTEIKPFALEQDNYLRARVIGTVVLKQVIVMPFLQSAIYAELLILSRPWLIMIVRNGVRAGMNVKSWIDKFILLRNPQSAV